MRGQTIEIAVRLGRIEGSNPIPIDQRAVYATVQCAYVQGVWHLWLWPNDFKPPEACVREDGKFELFAQMLKRVGLAGFGRCRPVRLW